MIPKDLKIPRNRINFILEKGNSTRSSLFIIKYSENNENFSRFCVIISKKFEKSAIKRNRLRRQIFEGIRLNLKENPSKKSLDIILIPKKSITDKDFDEIKEETNSILSRP